MILVTVTLLIIVLLSLIYKMQVTFSLSYSSASSTPSSQSQPSVHLTNTNHYHCYFPQPQPNPSSQFTMTRLITMNTHQSVRLKILSTSVWMGIALTSNTTLIYKPVANHFNSPNHHTTHLSMVLEVMRSRNVDLRRRRESFWVFQLQSLHPGGLNLDPWAIFTLFFVAAFLFLFYFYFYIIAYFYLLYFCIHLLPDFCTFIVYFCLFYHFYIFL